jgi:L-cysteine/cystine lyase
VTAVSGWDAVRADPHFMAGELTLTPGGRVAPLRSSGDRSSFVVATGATTREAVEAAERLAAAVRVEVDPDVDADVEGAGTGQAAPGHPDEDRLQALREALPGIVRGGYFNSGYTGALCRPAHEAVGARAEHEYRNGRMGNAHRAEVARILDDARRAVAELIGTVPEQVALTHHTTEAMNIVVHGLDWQPGDNAVTTRIEHKGGVLPLGVLRRRRGVELRAVAWDVLDPMDDLVRRLVEAIDDRTRIVALSHVSYVNGGVVDLAPVVEAAHRHGALVLVDGAQAAGTIPVDVGALGVDAYAVSGQKWLCGPEDTGALYVHPDALDRIAQTYVGWASVTTWDVEGTFAPNPDVSRFEVGTRSVPLIAGFAAAIRWLLDDVGLDWAVGRTYALAELARKELRDRAGAVVLTPGEHAGLVSFRVGAAPDPLVAWLGERGTTVRSIYGYDCVRASIGWFHTEDEVARLVDDVIRGARAVGAVAGAGASRA